MQISTEDSNLPKDTVISQTPGQGEAAEPSAAIKLVVSTGVVSTDPAAQAVKLQVTVPDTGKHSTLNIYVDGELQFTKSESLDGGSVPLTCKCLTVPGWRSRWNWARCLSARL